MINWKQKSSIRGAIWFIAGILSVLAVFTGNDEGALTIMAIAGTVAGGVGMAND